MKCIFTKETSKFKCPYTDFLLFNSVECAIDYIFDHATDNLRGHITDATDIESPLESTITGYIALLRKEYTHVLISEVRNPSEYEIGGSTYMLMSRDIRD